MREFVALAKREPGKLNYGSAGPASINHLALELLNARAGIDIVHVPYKGIAPATLDLIAGQIQAMTGTVSATLPYIADRKVKALAVTGARRAPLLPDVPTFSEVGYKDMDIGAWYAFFAPAGTPRAVVARLNAAVATMLSNPEFVERQKLSIKFVFGADHNESFKTLAAGKADAFANDDVQLFGMLAETRSGSDFRVVGDFLTYADYALTLRRDDPEFAEVVERAFHKLAGSREIVAIYERWFMKPLPSGERLNLPMSPHLEELFRVQGLPSD
jgi:ABC-type amino acid transport substrate-binding protein